LRLLFLFVGWDAAGGLMPLLGVARRLSERGHDVRLLASPSTDRRCGRREWRFRCFQATPDYDIAAGKDMSTEVEIISHNLWFNPAVALDLQAELALEPADVLALPAPQQPHVPVLVAGGGPRTTLRFVATYGDACNIGAASWAGGGFTGEDARRKFEVLERCCAEVARDPRSILRTSIVGPLFLAETEEAARAKLDRLRSWIIAGDQGLPGLEALVFAGTPESAVTYVRGLLDAGHQYLIYRALESDPETLELLSHRVVPAVQAASVGT
jgi:hypothetical protein